MLKTNTIDYRDKETLLEGFVAMDTKHTTKRPLVLIVHDWTGRSDFVCKKAEKLAELGYVGFAVDMYGKGILGDTRDKKAELSKPFFNDRALMRQRISSALVAAQSLEMVDTSRMAAIGFCFGGTCALDLARSGAPLRGVVSFHGGLAVPDTLPNAHINAKILVLHGYNDPMVPPQQVSVFEKEMTTAGTDWQLHVYGNTLHAFTNPEANDADFGTVYNACSDQRSWLAMKNFLDEIFV